MAYTKLRSKNYRFLKFGANVLFYWGIAVTGLIAIGIFAEGWDPESSPKVIFGTMFIGVAPLILGWSLRKKVKKRMQNDSSYALERALLETAKKHNGILSIPQASMDLHVSMDEAKKILDEYTLRNVCEIDSDDDGVIFYRFKVFLKK